MNRAEDMMRGWFTAYVKESGGQTSVPIPWTWNLYVQWCDKEGISPDVGAFQETLWDLEKDGLIHLIALARHEPLQDEHLALRGDHGEIIYYWRFAA